MMSENALYSDVYGTTIITEILQNILSFSNMFSRCIFETEIMNDIRELKHRSTYAI